MAVAIREIADAHDMELVDVAKLIYVSNHTVWSWYRAKGFRPPKMALALLCYHLGLKPHKLLKD